MKILVATALGVVVAAAGAIQLLSNGAAGRVAAAHSLPRFLAASIGDGPAYKLGLMQRSSQSDVLTLSARVDDLDKTGDYRAADALQRSIVDRLARGQDNVLLADALWRLGQLDAEIGYVEVPKRRAQWQLAFQDYKRALQLEPLSETILLAAANQALLDGDRKDALDYFTRAIAVDPASAEAREGLHRAQTGEGEPPPYVAPAEQKAHG